MLGHWCESAKHEHPWDVGLGNRMHRRSSKLSTACGDQYSHSDSGSKSMRRPPVRGNVKRKVSHWKHRETLSENICNSQKTMIYCSMLMDNGDSGPGAQWEAPDLHDKIHKSRHILLSFDGARKGSGLGAADLLRKSPMVVVCWGMPQRWLLNVRPCEWAPNVWQFCFRQKLARLIFKLKVQVRQYSTNLMRSLSVWTTRIALVRIVSKTEQTNAHKISGNVHSVFFFFKIRVRIWSKDWIYIRFLGSSPVKQRKKEMTFAGWKDQRWKVSVFFWFKDS